MAQQPRVRGIDEPAWTVTGEGSQRCGRGAGTDRARERLPRSVVDAGRAAAHAVRRGQGGHFALATAFHEVPADTQARRPDAFSLTITANGDSDRPGGNPLALVAAHRSRRTAGTMTGTGARWMRRCRRCSEPLAAAAGLTHLEAFGQNAKGFGPGSAVPDRNSPARRAMPRSALSDRLLRKREGRRGIPDPMGRWSAAERFWLGHRRRRGTTQLRDIACPHAHPRASLLPRAQGFPENYIIDRGADGRKLPGTRRCAHAGTASARRWRARLVEANVGAFRDVGLEAAAA